MIGVAKKKLEKNGDANASLITTTQKKKKYLGEVQKKSAMPHNFVDHQACNGSSISIEVW
jgi:hypothetical protein